jgi:hypothetical protein
MQKLRPQENYVRPIALHAVTIIIIIVVVVVVVVFVVVLLYLPFVLYVMLFHT